MPIKSLKNQYRGINAHLHSLCQNPGDSPTIWTSFHASHIGDLTNTFNSLLPQDYIARAEQSLQIWAEDDESAGGYSRPKPDVALYRSNPTPLQSKSATTAIAADPSVRLISLEDVLIDEPFEITSVVIYHVDEHSILGHPVTRIELLSTGNKLGKKGNAAYMHNRAVALDSGTTLIELDYLHQTPSPLPKMPAYPNDNDSHAYTIAITDEREDQNPHNLMIVYVRDVDMALPERVNIPLAGTESVTFDFDRVYQYTFEAGRWGSHIDYEQPPRNVESYSAADQDRIKAVMTRAANSITNESD